MARDGSAAGVSHAQPWRRNWPVVVGAAADPMNRMEAMSGGS
jgi:hypothetical protein